MVKSRPVLVINSTLAALQVLAGAAVLSDVFGPTIFALFSIAVASVQVGVNYYVQGQVVPAQDTVAYVDQNGNAVAGPAAGVTNGTQVEVVPSPTASN